jgi:hypothetical protein
MTAQLPAYLRAEIEHERQDRIPALRLDNLNDPGVADLTPQARSRFAAALELEELGRHADAERFMRDALEHDHEYE